MSNRTEEILRRHQERKKNRLPSDYIRESTNLADEKEDRPLWQNDTHSGTGRETEKGHPLIKKESFLFRTMAAAVLFLGVGVLYKSASPTLDQERAFVQQTFDHEFQFAMVADWYQNEFGEPLALLPHAKKKNVKVDKQNQPSYAVPVNGTVTENFKDTGEKGIMLQTGSKAEVDAVKQGFVTFVGKKKGLGKTVVIQLQDGGEVWYGMLDNVNVGLYDYVQQGEKVGTVTPSKNGKSGQFFFALKQNNAFVNPLKEIPFG